MRSTPATDPQPAETATSEAGEPPRPLALSSAAERLSPALPFAVAVLLALSVVAAGVVGGDEDRRRVDEYASGGEAELYVAGDAGFRAEFPTAPRRRTQRVVVDGVKVPVVDYTSGVGASDFTVSFAEIPVAQDIGDPIVRLNASANGAAAAVKGTLLSSTITSLVGLPAVEYVISVDDRFVKATSVLSGRRLYGVQVVGKTNPPPGYDRFVASLQLAG